MRRRRLIRVAIMSRARANEASEIQANLSPANRDERGILSAPDAPLTHGFLGQGSSKYGLVET